MELELVEANNPDMKSEVMSLAAQYRDQGMSPSEALHEAWTIIRGAPWDDSDEEDEDDIFVLSERPRTRRNPTKRSSESDSSIGLVLLLGVVGYLAWCAIKYAQTKAWSWTPWKQPVGRRLPNPAMKASQQLTPPPMYSRNGYEQVTLIVP
jgi:hypothetical protein